MKIRLKPQTVPKLFPYAVIERCSRHFVADHFTHLFYGYSDDIWDARRGGGLILWYNTNLDDEYRRDRLVPVRSSHFKLRRQMATYPPYILLRVGDRYNINQESDFWRVAGTTIEWPRLEVYANYHWVNQCGYKPMTYVYHRVRFSIVLGQEVNC